MNLTKPDPIFVNPFSRGEKHDRNPFKTSPHGANASAHLYSLIETAKANALNDYCYLKYVFTELPKARDDDDIAKLLPWRVDRTVIDQQLNKPVNT